MSNKKLSLVQMYPNTDPDFSLDKKIRFLLQAAQLTQLGMRHVNKVPVQDLTTYKALTTSN